MSETTSLLLLPNIFSEETNMSWEELLTYFYWKIIAEKEKYLVLSQVHKMELSEWEQRKYWFQALDPLLHWMRTTFLAGKILKVLDDHFNILLYKNLDSNGQCSTSVTRHDMKCIMIHVNVIARVGPWAIDPFNNKKGPLTTEIAILNSERMAHWNFTFIANKWKMAHTMVCPAITLHVNQYLWHITIHVNQYLRHITIHANQYLRHIMIHSFLQFTGQGEKRHWCVTQYSNLLS